MNELSSDILLHIFKKLHRFKYLDNLSLTSKYISNNTKIIYKYHYKIINNYLDFKISNYYYNISKLLFHSKILNFNKIKKKYYNSIQTLNISNLVKILIIFNEYYDTITSKSYLKIIDFKDVIKYIDNIPFIIINLSMFYMIIEYSPLTLKYRIKLRHNISKVSIYKEVNENDILHIFTLTKNDIFRLYF